MLDPTTLAAYRAAQTAPARAQAVRDSLGSGTLTVELREGASLVYSGTFSGPMTAGADGSLSASAQLAGLVTTAGTPNAATWTCRIANGSGRYIEGSFGPGGRFTWSQGTLRVGDLVRLDVSIAAAGASALGGNRRIAIWGQSNAVGRAERSDLSAEPLATSDPGLATFDAGTFSRVFIGTGSGYEQLTPATNNGCDAGQFGAEFGLAVRWMRETTTGNLYIEKEASSGVSITYFDPLDWIYGGMVTRRAGWNSWLSGNGISLTDDGWLWVQGESDAAQTKEWYASRLSALIAARLDDGLDAAESMRVISQVWDTTTGPAQAKTEYVAANPLTSALTFFQYVKPDNVHLNGRGMVQLGYDAFEKIFSAPHLDA